MQRGNDMVAVFGNARMENCGMSLQGQAEKSSGRGTPFCNKSQNGNPRLMSVDALRGFVMFWIIGGDAPILIGLAKGTGSEFLNNLLVQFEHVHWEGFRCWDLVMPLFLFVVGVVMPFSFNKRLERGQSKRQLYFHIIKRVLILWVLGMVAQGNLLEYDLSTLQIYSNTLQSIAAGYLIASILILHVIGGHGSQLGNLFLGKCRVTIA